ncbi:putative reverse transcriptase domain-containing protein [Tanacetum coccineum]
MWSTVTVSTWILARFIENFSKIAKPLTLLTQKNKTYVWGDEQDIAFRILKEKLCNALVLALPDGPDDFVVYYDASKQGFGSVLMQRGKVIAYIRCDKMYEKFERLALMACMKRDMADWDTHLQLVEFSYNNNYHTAISITIRALYEAKLRSPEIWTKGKIETARVARKAMLIRGVSLLNSKLETECYLRYLHGREWYDLVRKESWHPHIWTEFEIVERVGPVAYRLKLPQELSCVHDTFHVSNLKKCLAEPDVQVPLDEIEIDENLRFVEEPIEIVERDVKKLKRRRIPLVKVRWNSRQGQRITWNMKTNSG